MNIMEFVNIIAAMFSIIGAIVSIIFAKKAVKSNQATGGAIIQDNKVIGSGRDAIHVSKNEN